MDFKCRVYFSFLKERSRSSIYIQEHPIDQITKLFQRDIVNLGLFYHVLIPDALQLIL